MPESKPLPLAGLRVIDITVVWSGPHCTQLLAEWGAEVIRVEPLQRFQTFTRYGEAIPSKATAQALKGSGNLIRHNYPDRDPGEAPWNRLATFNSHARNKRSMTLDVMEPEGRALFLRLVRIADIVVENNVPQTIERAGLTYEALCAVNPRILLLRMPAYGLSGPYRGYRSFGSQMEGMTGHHLIRGYPDLDPGQSSDVFVADAAAGVQGAFALLLALRHLRRTGQGQQIELAQAENFLPYIGEVILDYTMNGRVWGPQGNRHPAHAPHSVYPCRGEDRWIAIDVASDEEWQALTRVLDAEALLCDPRFAGSLERWQHQPELDAALAALTADWDAFDLFHALQAAGVSAGPVQNEADAYACPQLQARGFFEELEQADSGTHAYPGLNLRLRNTPNHLRGGPCPLGADNDYVYRELLDLPEDEIARLTAAGHIGTGWSNKR